MPDPRTSQFWAAEDAELGTVLADLIMGTLLVGAEEGTAALPANIRDLVVADTLSTAALDFTQAYSYELIGGINGVTQEQVASAIDAWIRSGEPLSSLEAQLVPIFGSTRAAAIAATEVTRVFASGNMLAWDATGMVGEHTWQTARDDLVCPICGPMHGQTVKLGEPFHLPNGKEVSAPPSHVRCRCWTKPKVSEAGLREQIRGLLP